MEAGSCWGRRGSRAEEGEVAGRWLPARREASRRLPAPAVDAGSCAELEPTLKPAFDCAVATSSWAGGLPGVASG